MRWSSYLPLLVFVALLAGCDDSTNFQIHPILVSDTVTVYAPLDQNRGLPTGLDITSDGAFGIVGGRFPERTNQALQWDFVVRMVNGQVALLPQRAVGVSDARSALTRPLSGVTFEGLAEAPGQASFVMDSAIVMAPGNVHAARSREMSGFGGGVCIQYSKIEPLTVNVAAGSVNLRVVTNERCSDPRLVPID